MTEPYNLDLAISVALEAREKSKALRSGYKVGACLVGEDDRGITCYLPGCNIELSGYPPIHAEHMAYVLGEFYQLKKHHVIVVACDKGFPMCGYCRQLYINLNSSMRVIGVDTRMSPPKVVIDIILSDLMPYAYPIWQGEELSNQEDSTKSH